MTRGIPRAALEETRTQIAEHKRFKELSRRLVEASEDLCRARLKAGRDAGRDAKRALCESLTEAFATDIAAEIEALVGPDAAHGIHFERLEPAIRKACLGVANRAAAVALRRVKAGVAA